eukprot:NODE_713_length_1235_cov_138.476391_g570_i0.p1 GENE.NODE_713_length_1235_cov_138.476391_g570_i0~~NODE_713_length_1235_cov_138.476391_g570_i0.p1  ORF type:complete len:314 (+),score=28.34 NODE_713_length_1235_cov_138.476391_g570_i0:25-942(+)
MGEQVAVGMQEASLLEELDHPHVVKLFRVDQSPDSIQLVMELLEGDLHSLILGRRIPEGEARRLFLQLAEAVAYVHSRGIVHLDIKPNNLLLDSHRNLKLTDFSLSCRQPHGSHICKRAGTLACVAPEVLDQNVASYDGMQADVWSCGVVLFAMLTGTLPFSSSDRGHSSIRAISDRILCGHFDLPAHLSPALQGLIRGLLVVDPSSRLTMKMIRSHPWLAQALGDSPLPPAALHFCPSIAVPQHPNGSELADDSSHEHQRVISPSSGHPSNHELSDSQLIFSLHDVYTGPSESSPAISSAPTTG